MKQNEDDLFQNDHALLQNDVFLFFLQSGDLMFQNEDVLPEGTVKNRVSPQTDFWAAFWGGGGGDGGGFLNWLHPLPCPDRRPGRHPGTTPCRLNASCPAGNASTTNQLIQ